MPKRSRIKKLTKESEALKRMRLSRKLSQRNAAEVVGVPQTTINHTENGRAYIKRDYIRKFINALGYSWSDRNEFLEGHDPQMEVKESCKQMIDALEKSKLAVVHDFLANYSK
ncbi:MAG: hypothetical protein CMJ16_04680 [Peredibacter sp.]|nr:hypothetical protein [Peredibacter sp.]